jgi:Mrp family chromosome partitioning ATPase
LAQMEDIQKALGNVIDPEIGVSITQLGMVKNVQVAGDHVRVLIALTVQGCPLAHTIQADITRELTKLDGIKTVEVETTSMSKGELEKLRVDMQQRMNSGPRAAGQMVGPGIELLDKKGIGSIIAIISGKGGVGKSFVTSLLAVELRREGYEVGVLDADITGPSIARIFGLAGKPEIGDKGIFPLKTKTGINAISVNLLLDDPQAATIWRGPIINQVIRQLYGNVDWGNLHFLLIDLPPGTSDAPLTVFQSLPLDGVIVVSTPQDLALMVVAKAINMAKKLKVPILGLVENMSYFECPHCGERTELYGPTKAPTAAKEANIPYLGAMPVDPKIAQLSDQGSIEDYSNPAFREIADRIRESASKMLGKAAMPIAWSKES